MLQKLVYDRFQFAGNALSSFMYHRKSLFSNYFGLKVLYELGEDLFACYDVGKADMVYADDNSGDGIGKP